MSVELTIKAVQPFGSVAMQTLQLAYYRAYISSAIEKDQRISLWPAIRGVGQKLKLCCRPIQYRAEAERSQMWEGAWQDSFLGDQ
jgi:hypothetical protein